MGMPALIYRWYFGAHGLKSLTQNLSLVGIAPCQTTLIGMIEENLIAERVAIDTYRETINYLESDDPTTRSMLEEILAMEEKHAEDLAGLLKELGS